MAKEKLIVNAVCVCFGKHKNSPCIIFQFPLIQVIYELFSVASMGLSTAP